jgi:hypothetical protein
MRSLIACAVGVSVLALPTASLSAWPRETDQPQQVQVQMEGQEEQIGRFAIVSPRAEMFLLDTTTGDVWQQVRITDEDGQPIYWVKMRRIDNPFAVKPVGPPAVKKDAPLSPDAAPKPVRLSEGRRLRPGTLFSLDVPSGLQRQATLGAILPSCGVAA